MASDTQQSTETQQTAEIRAVNERLVITSIRQQEHAEKAQQQAERSQQAELKSEENLTHLLEAHDGLRATHKHLKDMHTEIQTAYEALQAAYEREHRIALALQRPLTLEVPEDAFSGLSVATLYSAAWEEAEVGGDFYDAIPLMDGRVAFVVGDASGKGITAAARAIEAKNVLRAYMHLYPFYAALMLTRLSDYLCDTQSREEQADGQFVALSLIVVSVQTSEATFAWAGIEPPALVRAGGPVERMAGHSLPLGVIWGSHYAETTIKFGPGDIILLSTDGLSEARRGKELLGEEGVDHLVQQSLAEPTLRDVGAAILTGAREYAGGKLMDDACLVLVRCH